MQRFSSLVLKVIVVSMLLILSHAIAQDLQKALSQIDEAEYTQRIKTLASDEFQGRLPATEGETKTINYLRDEYRKIGLKPGNGDSYFQEVGLVQITSHPDERLEIKGTGRGLSLGLGSQFVAQTRRMVDKIDVRDAEMVFAGYGIVAPEYNWNDYAGLDAKGKIVVVLVNDPGFATQDSALFTGRAMTYYGRWTYKYEEAARQGAAGVLIVHEPAPAGYPWFVVQSGWSGPEFHMEAADKNMSRCQFEGWISGIAARSLFGQAGLNYEEEIDKAAKPGFTYQPFGLTASLSLTNDISYSKSNNVLALLPGTDRADEIVIYSAHWDHFGVNPEMDGDNIFNGARDNATGTAALLELADAFVNAPEPPRRSILFLAVTAEEQGLLGSAYYAAHPVYPLNKTVAALNMDALNIFGKMKDITVIGLGNSQLDAYVEAAATAQGRYVRPDPEPEKGIFFRSDHFSFAKEGVPSLYTKMGIDHVSKSQDEVLAISNKWTAELYHKPGDEYDPATWDLSGAIDDIRLMFRVGYQLSRENTFPEWNDGNAFKARRDADMAN